MSLAKYFMAEVTAHMKANGMTWAEALEDVHSTYRANAYAAEENLAAYEDFLVDVWRSKQDAE